MISFDRQPQHIKTICFHPPTQSNLNCELTQQRLRCLLAPAWGVCMYVLYLTLSKGPWWSLLALLSKQWGCLLALAYTRCGVCLHYLISHVQVTYPPPRRGAWSVYLHILWKGICMIAWPCLYLSHACTMICNTHYTIPLFSHSVPLPPSVSLPLIMSGAYN